MNDERKQKEERKKQKKKIRKELEEILELLKKDCDKFEEFEKLFEKVKGKLIPFLDNYREYLDASIVKTIQDQIARIDQSKEAVQNLCELRDKVEKLKNTLYSPGMPQWFQDLPLPAPIVSVPVGVLAVIVVAAAAVVAAAPLVAATIKIGNNGCDPIPVPQGIPNLPGLSFWKEPIADGSAGGATIPPITITVDARQENSILISFLNMGSIPLPMSGVKSILFNGEEIKDRVVVEQISIQGSYTLDIRCK